MQVYALIDERDDQAFYVGKTNDSERRLKEHLKDRRTQGAEARYERIQAILADDRQVELRVLETCDSDVEAAMAERKWYEKLIADGADLLNEKPPQAPPFERVGFEPDNHTLAECKNLMNLTREMVDKLDGPAFESARRLARIRVALLQIEEQIKDSVFAELDDLYVKTEDD